MQYVLLFMEGIITFISPCMLPMLPIYLIYFSGTEGGKKAVLKHAIAFVLGFTVVFVLLGAFAGLVGQFLIRYQLWFNLFSGLVVILFGLSYLGVISIPLFNKQKHHASHNRELNTLSAALFGIVFSIGWTPCVGAFLGSALMMASLSGSTLSGVLMLLVYSMGLGLPFILSAVLIDQLKTTFDFIKRHYKVINTVSGIFLILIGILMATGHMGRLLSLLAV